MTVALGDRVIDLSRKGTNAERIGVVVDLPNVRAKAFQPPARDDSATVAGLSTPRFGKACRNDRVVSVAFVEDLNAEIGSWWQTLPADALKPITAGYEIRLFHFPTRRLEAATEASTHEEEAIEAVEVSVQ